MQRVYIAQSHEEANLVADQLRAAGIGAVVNTDRTAAPSVPFPSVWVREPDVEAALEVVRNRAGPFGGAA